MNIKGAHDQAAGLFMSVLHSERRTRACKPLGSAVQSISVEIFALPPTLTSKKVL